MGRRTESEVRVDRERIIRRIVGEAVRAEKVRKVRQRMANCRHLPARWRDQSTRAQPYHGTRGDMSREEVTYSRMPITQGSVR